MDASQYAQLLAVLFSREFEHSEETQPTKSLFNLFILFYFKDNDVDLIESFAPLDATNITSTYKRKRKKNKHQSTFTYKKKTQKESLEIIRDALREDWSLPEFEQRLRSGAGIEHAEVLLRFFKSHSVRMRDSVAASHVWNDTLSSLAWRVDVKTKSRKGTLAHSTRSIDPPH
jgi:hypothetical protein